MIDIELQQTQYMTSKGKSIVCFVHSDKACISTEVAKLIYDKVEKNQVVRTKIMQQELCRLRSKEEMELDEVQEQNPYEMMLIQDIKEKWLK